ncbi:SCO family protein [Mucilaginibacter boryungensis]|uniref:SCO family protein n=1 Tax=Mucilaginibacter boryungensis TaxID=768480 RepID=A0ABR9XGU4_9SPHI|nr:SCO family protein [Mucilaginibacter boryungensis]MBE9666280.1 SCO family protein [Mucilaginibacter boryungensis]
MKRAIIILSGIAIAISACKSGTNNALPILGNRTPVTKTVNGKTVTDTIYKTIPDFKMVNQYGDSISSKNLNGKIYVADFFFTSCPSICPVMHRNMLNVYNEFKNAADFKILSYSIDPKYDSVAVMKKYADKLGISGQAWWLLQGKKDETYKLAESYLTHAADDASAPGGHIHDGYFILVDKQKHIRGAYDGTQPDQVTKLIADIKTLQAEPDQSIAQ